MTDMFQRKTPGKENRINLEASRRHSTMTEVVVALLRKNSSNRYEKKLVQGQEE
jgi:hypothetical protein